MSFQLHSRSLACALLALSYAALPTAQAQEVPAGPNDGQTRQQQPGAKLERVEVSSRALSDTDLRRRAPVAKQIYGREEIDKYGDSNVADVLKRLPGVSVSGNAPRMRGLGSGYTLILINGDPAPPGFQLDQLDPKQVERIEVTKGPTADQSAQAVAGAINIILRDAPRVSQRDLGLRMGYNAERPVGGLNFTWGERVLGGVAVSVPVSLFEWRGRNDSRTEKYAIGSDLQPARSVQEATVANWGHGFNTSPRLNWKINEDEALTVQGFGQDGHWNNRTSYVNSGLSGQPLLEDDNLSKGSWQMARANAQYNNRFNENQRIELKLGAQASKGTFDVQTYRDGGPRRRSLGDNQDHNFTQAGKFAQLIGDSHSLTLGWDLEWRRRDEKRETTELGQPLLPEFESQPFGARIERQALFVQDEWEIAPQWSTYLGLRGERIVTESRGMSEAVRNTSKVVTPLWHLNYKLDPKGRDLIRASLTRSYKAPELNSLLGRPALNSLHTDASKTNTELSPDRMGNPNLKPELATGLDVAFEKYLPGGGMFSIGVFHRQVKDLIRSVTTLQSVSWASAQRWVSQPVNFSRATTSGLELELKGRAGELLPSLFDPKLALNLRSSLNIYRSRVEALSGPNNRLDGQQPWSANLGFDYRITSLPMPIVTGANLAYTPGYLTQQTSSQSLDQGRARSLDMFAQLILSKDMSVRVMANNFAPLDSSSRTVLSSGYYTGTVREGRTWWGAMLELKL